MGEDFSISDDDFENGICEDIMWAMKRFQVYTTAEVLAEIDKYQDGEHEEEDEEIRENIGLSVDEILAYCKSYAYSKWESLCTVAAISDDNYDKYLFEIMRSKERMWNNEPDTNLPDCYACNLADGIIIKKLMEEKK